MDSQVASAETVRRAVDKMPALLPTSGGTTTPTPPVPAAGQLGRALLAASPGGVLELVQLASVGDGHRGQG